MDAYQKHLERQLQQQQHQIRLQGNDPNAPRHLASQPPQQQGSIQHPPQWTTNILPGTQPQTLPAGAPGFPRGMPNNPMGIGSQQQAAQQVAQGQTNTFASSPQALVQNLQSPAQAPSQKSQSSPAPGSPVIGDPQEKLRIATILEINSHLIKICLSMQSSQPNPNVIGDPTYSGCLQRLQQNLAYLAAIADRANKPEAANRALPNLSLLSAPPNIRIVEERDALDKLYKSLSSLQPGVDSNGDNGSDAGSQVDSPQIRSRQTSAGSLNASGTQRHHTPTPPLQRSQLPGHPQHHTPSPHLIPSQIHGQSGLNPNPTQPNVRPAQTQQQHFQQNFAQGQQHHPQNPNLQFQQNPQFQQQNQNQQFQQQNPNIQYSQPQNTQFQQNQNQHFSQSQNPQFQQQNQNQQQFPQQTQTPQFQQNTQFQQNQQSFQAQPHVQPRAPSRPPSRPSSQHSLAPQSHHPSPTISPRPPHQPPPGPSPQLASAPNPQATPSPRMGLPPNLTPEQTAVLQERMRLTREARIQQFQAQQQASGNPMNMFPMQNGVQNQPNGFNTFHGGGMINGMSSTSPTQNQNFGAGSPE